MAECIISSVVSVVKEYAMKEAEALAEVGDRIMLLNDKLEWLQTFVRDADQKRRSKENPFVAVWVRQTRDVAFQMEDVLDDYFRKTFLAEMERSKLSAFFKCLAQPCSQLCILDDLANRMNKIEKRLVEISTNKGDNNIQSVGEPSSIWTSSSSTNLAAWDNLEEITVGFEDYETKLKKELIDPGTESLKIISIIGESGLGKTKLARKIYDSEEFQKHFKIRCWNLLPPKYAVSDILTNIRKKVSNQVTNESKVQRYKGNDITHTINDELDEGRYLVVLDGIASIADWNIIKAVLPDLENGSRVLIIMQSDREGVENFVDASLNEFKIEPLDEEGSTKLFLNRVFGQQKYPSWFDKTRDVQDVFVLTQGVPLAIVILAGLLRSKASQAEWSSVFQKLKDVNRVKALGRILAMSFDDLPHSLKTCFLYLSALPETTLHTGHKLVRLWIAEGFIKPKHGRTLEEIGQQYLKELVSRCLVQLVRKDAQGDVESIAIHDKVHAFMRTEAQDVNFFEIHDNVDVIAPSTVRRLSIQNHTHKYVPLKNSFPKLRSLICDFAEKEENTNKQSDQTSQKQDTLLFKYLRSHSHICGFAEKEENTNALSHQTSRKQDTLRFFRFSKFLRVIDLQGLLLENLPNEVGNMIHLRYLGVNKCGLKQLPASIGKLIYLQTFDIKETSVGETIWDIPTLRHIFAYKIKPSNSIKAKDNLQTLHGVDCTNWNPTLLEKVSNLQSLEIEGLNNSHWKAFLDALKKLELLVHLKLKCSEKASVPRDIFDISVLRRLHSLEIDGTIQKAQTQESKHINSTLPNLTKLTLRNTKISQKFISMLAKYPRLSFLKLGDLSYDEENETLAFPESGFQSLNELELSLGTLENWRIGKSAMPKLAILKFWRCERIATIPDSIKDMDKLKEVMVYESPNIARIIQDKQGRDYENIKHASIIRVRWDWKAAQKKIRVQNGLNRSD